LLQRVLREGALRQFDPGHLPQDRRQSPHWHAVTIVQRMGYRFHPRPDPMRGGAILIRRYVRMFPPHGSTAFPTAARLHSEQTHHRLRPGRNVGHRDLFHIVGFQPSATKRTPGMMDRHIHRRAARCRGRFRSPAKFSLPRLSSWLLGMLFPFPFGEGRRAAVLLAAQLLYLLP
jgi:hypothetical protein